MLRDANLVGVPRTFGGISDPKKILKRIGVAIREIGVVLLHGGTAELRLKVACFVLMRAASHGRDVYSIDLNAVIEGLFQPDRDQTRERVNTVGLLWLRLDFLRKHSWAETTLQQILAQRSGRTTLVTSSVSVGFAAVSTYDVGLVTWRD